MGEVALARVVAAEGVDGDDNAVDMAMDEANFVVPNFVAIALGFPSHQNFLGTGFVHCSKPKGIVAMGFRKGPPHPVNRDFMELAMDCFVGCFVFNASYRGLKLGSHLDLAGIGLVPLAIGDGSPITGKIFVPGVAIFVGSLEQILGTALGQIGDDRSLRGLNANHIVLLEIRGLKGCLLCHPRVALSGDLGLWGFRLKTRFSDRATQTLEPQIREAVQTRCGKMRTVIAIFKPKGVGVRT